MDTIQLLLFWKKTCPLSSCNSYNLISYVISHRTLSCLNLYQMIWWETNHGTRSQLGFIWLKHVSRDLVRKSRMTRSFIQPASSVIIRIYDLISFDLMFGVWHHFQQYFNYIMATSFSGGRSRSTRWEPPTMGKQLVSCITCGCELSCTLFVIYKAGRETTPYWW